MSVPISYEFTTRLHLTLIVVFRKRLMTTERVGPNDAHDTTIGRQVPADETRSHPRSTLRTFTITSDVTCDRAAVN